MVLFGLALIVATALLFDPSPGSSTLPNPPCSGVLIIGLRGNGDSLNQDHGMGGDVWATSARMTVVLLADAARVAGTAYDTLASRWNGVLAPLVLSSRWTLQGPTVQDNLPNRMTDRVRSYCLAGDAVCNFSPGASPQLFHSSVHTSYRRKPDGVADAAANFAAARVAADLSFSRGG